MRIFSRFPLRKIVSLTALAMVIAACVVPSAAPPSIIDVTALKVVVWFERAGVREQIEELESVEIQENDRIAVEEAGRALLRFTNNIVVELFRETGVMVQDARIEPTGSVFLQLKLEHGTARTNLVEQARSRVSIVTDYAVIQPVEPNTEYLVCHAPELTCMVTLRGGAEVEANGEVVSVEAGESSYIFPGEAPSPPICADLTQIDQWIDQKRDSGSVEVLGAIVAGWPQEPCSTTTATATLSETVEPALTPTPSIAGLYLVNPVDGAEYVHVAGGEFTMGADAGVGISNLEQPRHTVTVEDFWIQRTEVTNAQYGRCVAGEACTPPSNDTWDDPARADHPVTHVSWQQANEYAQWAGGRLPTEAEWEKACRSNDGRTYAWGDAPPTAELANFADIVGESTAVGSYPAGVSVDGALDMNGNVWEWTTSLNQAYPYRADDGRESLNTEGERVARGGSFYYTKYQLTCTSRFSLLPNSANEYVGLRIVISP